MREKKYFISKSKGGCYNMKNKLISMPEQLFEKIKESAIRNDRSVNKEITKILKKSFKKNERPN